MSSEEIVREALKQGKLVIGKEKVLGMMKHGSLESVIYAANTPKIIIKDIGYYGKISKIELHESTMNSASLGQLCGKPFGIIVLGVKKK